MESSTAPVSSPMEEYRYGLVVTTLDLQARAMGRLEVNGKILDKRANMSVCVCVYTYVYVCMCSRMYTFKSTCICMCTCIQMRKSRYVDTFMYIYIYTETHRFIDLDPELKSC